MRTAGCGVPKVNLIGYAPGDRSFFPRFDQIVGLRHSGSKCAAKLFLYRPLRDSAGECGSRAPEAPA